MGTEIKVWQIKNKKLELIETTMIETGRTEPQDLEKWVKNNPEIFGENILIIGEQVQTKSGPLDLLGIDELGNIIIIELKREQIPREALAQAIDYASDVASWDIDKLNELCNKYNNKSLEEIFTDKFSDIDLDSLSINQAQRILLVGTSIEESLQRMIEWLSDEYEMGINSILLKYIKTPSGDELLARTMLIPEEEEQEKIRKKQGKRPDFSVRIKNAVKEGKLKKGDVFVLDIEKSNLDDDSRKKINGKIATEGDRFMKIELTGIDNRLHVVKWLYDDNTYAIGSVGWSILKSLELPGTYYYNFLYSWKKEGANEYISDLIS